MDKLLSSIVNKFVDIKYNSAPASSSKDIVFSYAKQLISIGCLYMEFAGAVREGDRQRVMRCWRYFMVVSKQKQEKLCDGSSQIVISASVHFVSTDVRRIDVFKPRFINVSGCPGRNISMDLYMEHLNRDIKNGIDHLGPNKTKSAINSKIRQSNRIFGSSFEQF